MTLQLVSGLSLWQSTAQDHYSSQFFCVLIYATEEILSLDTSREVSVSFTWTNYILLSLILFIVIQLYRWCLFTSNRIVIQLFQSCIFLSVTCNLMLIWSDLVLLSLMCIPRWKYVHLITLFFTARGATWCKPQHSFTFWQSLLACYNCLCSCGFVLTPKIPHIFVISSLLHWGHWTKGQLVPEILHMCFLAM